jgi:hypothetical protein
MEYVCKHFMKGTPNSFDDEGFSCCARLRAQQRGCKPTRQPALRLSLHVQRKYVLRLHRVIPRNAALAESLTSMNLLSDYERSHHLS